MVTNRGRDPMDRYRISPFWQYILKTKPWGRALVVEPSRKVALLWVCVLITGDP